MTIAKHIDVPSNDEQTFIYNTIYCEVDTWRGVWGKGNLTFRMIVGFGATV